MFLELGEPKVTAILTDSVQSTLSKLLLGGSGGMPPQENFEK